MSHKSILKNEVLFQKLGLTWYAFSEINGEIIYSALPQGIDPKSTKLELYQIIEDHMGKMAEIQQRQAVSL